MVEIDIRPMDERDLSRVAELSSQLGYSVPGESLARRFLQMAESAEHALWVAESAGRLAGWIHVCGQYSLESQPYAEIGGLVVDHEMRRLGVGRALVAAAQQWARDHGFDRLRVRSNVNRTEAHAFYPALGFAWIKTQHNYELRFSASR